MQQVRDVLPLWLLYGFDEDLGFEELPCEAWILEDGLALLWRDLQWLGLEHWILIFLLLLEENYNTSRKGRGLIDYG